LETAALPQSLPANLPLKGDEPLTFVCFKWRPPVGYRSKFEAQTVNVLYSMLKRHYKKPFELVCVTDEPRGIIQEVRAVKLWSDYANVPSPHGRGNPSCYRRLKMFSRGAGEIFGPRICSIDLDVVICREITQLFDIGQDFKMYGDTARGTPYNGSLIYHRAGARPQLWEKFDPLESPKLGIRLKYIGSDQAWIGACLGPNEAKFTKADGVYSYRNQIMPGGGFLPPTAKIVIMHGHVDPWDPHVQRKHRWIAEHYR
jgi:hypothetical protein